MGNRARKAQTADATIKPMRQFLVTLLLIWAAASIAAFVYSQQQHISHTLLLALLPAFLVEIGFYLMPGFETVRKLFDALGPKALRAGLLVASAIAPYLLESWRLGTFRLESLLILTALVSMAAFWYALLKPSLLLDFLFLVLMAGVYVSLVFVDVYPRPAPDLDLEILGRLMWIRLGVMAVLSLRRLENIRFGFLPKRDEWRIGVEQFLYFLPVGGLAALFCCISRALPAGNASVVENDAVRPRHLLRHSLGARSGRGVFLPRPVAAVVDPRPAQ